MAGQVVSAGGRPLRADARRKREDILAAAAEAFAKYGVDVPLEEVARAAGVGIATLFRHFPARSALITEVYLRDVDLLCDGVDELLEQLPADEALRAWMQRFVSYVAGKAGMAIALRAIIMDTDTSIFQKSNDRVYAATRQFLAAAESAGLVRCGIDPDDLVKALGGVTLVTDRPDRQDQAKRLVSMLLDGLR